MILRRRRKIYINDFERHLYRIVLETNDAHDNVAYLVPREAQLGSSKLKYAVP